jgi:hypothetical protein
MQQQCDKAGQESGALQHTRQPVLRVPGWIMAVSRTVVVKKESIRVEQVEMLQCISDG